jgi:DNA-binding beta-propeller fold protein YncE
MFTMMSRHFLRLLASRGLVLIWLLAALFLNGCAPAPQEAQPRFFWPPPPVEPRIEYIDFYQVEEDLQRDRDNWLAEAILGKEVPQSVFKSPADVASDGKGRVLVSDLSAKQVFVFDFNTQEVSSLLNDGGAPMLMQAPLGLAFDERGWAYVADVNARKILIFNQENRLEKIIGNDQLQHPTGVAANSELGRIYVADAWAHQIVVYDFDGQEVDRFGKRGSRAGDFNFPVDLDVDEDGTIFVLDAMNARVQVLDADGGFVRMFGERGTASGSFQIPKGLSVSRSGQVYVTDGLGHKLVIFSREGDFLLSLGGQAVFSNGEVNPGGFYMPRGVDVDNGEAIWIVDSLNNMFHQFQFLTEEYLQQNPIVEEQVFRLNQ